MSVPLIPAQRFVVLDSFRGLCALAVAVFHLHIVGSFAEGAFFRSAGLFVEFFFTLSGFVLCHSYAQKAFGIDRLRSFLISRTFRIFPLHLAILLLFTVLEIARLLALHQGAFSRSLFREWLANVALLQAWLPGTNPFSFNGPAWSISVEFYLYLLFGGLLFLCAARYWRLAYALLVLACTACVMWGVAWTGSGGFRGLTCFFFGALAYEAYRRSLRWQISRYWMTVLEVAALFGVYACLTLQYPHKSYFATGYFALCIVLFARERGGVSHLLQRTEFVNLGHWSFSIYLTHYVLIHLLTQSVALLNRHGFTGLRVVQLGNGPLYFDTGNGWLNQLLVLVLLALVLKVASVSYRQIEQRGIALGKQFSGKPLMPITAALALARK